MVEFAAETDGNVGNTASPNFFDSLVLDLLTPTLKWCPLSLLLVNHMEMDSLLVLTTTY